MKKIFFNLLKGEKVTVRNILDKKISKEENLVYLVIALHKTEEKVQVCIEIQNEAMIKTNSDLYYAANNTIGYILCENGMCPFGIELP